MKLLKDHSHFADNELLQLLAQDNDMAFKILYNRYASYLYRTATGRLNNEVIAQDLVQEVFVSLYNNRHNLGHITELKGWLYACLRNRILNEIRNEQLHLRHHEQMALKTTAVTQTYDSYDLHVLEQQYKKALSQLSGRSREVFLLSREQHLSNKDIADKLQVSLKAIEKHITSALKIMRRELVTRRLLISPFLLIAWLGNILFW
ncbi:RNA polymerase sigma-70 factor [Mucilaginibacter terrigena]|uniref:RNA polymerase sigma-70 factor n=1 Tax=Mucilaginibacter terrigena TaxID=2492395 RepID=A0A4Q5LRI9_9SPHI|nr:RNA polymerase sigma-70 factor [Mucilaginibacter terrigena]RYU92121.1 RNA polymerase sigma-70 factor [Mucilaginibacter terrigena]